MSIKAIIEGKEVELKPDELKLGEGFALITPDKVPEGYFTQDAVNTLVKDNVNRAKSKTRESLLEDESIHQQILGRYNVTLGEDGKPKGLKPDFDPEAWKKEQAKKLTDPYEQKLADTTAKLEQFKKGLVRAEILKSANGLFREEFTKSFTGSEDPFVVKQFADAFDVDDEGNVAQKDKDGTFAVSGDGSRITPQKFFEANKDKFASLLQDKRQGGSGFQSGGAGRSFSAADVATMSDSEYEKHRSEILKATAEGRMS